MSAPRGSPAAGIDDDGDEMTASNASPRGRAQGLFTAAMLVAAALLFGAVMWVTAPAGGVLTLQGLFLLGTLLAAIALAGAVWLRPRVIWLMSGLLVAVGVASLVLMAVVPVPRADPTLFEAGVWRTGALGFLQGWDRYLMGSLLTVAGLLLPLNLGPDWRPMLLSLTQLRFTIWFGAMWQLTSLTLGGRSDRLFTGEVLLLQIGLAVLAAVGVWLVGLGDRRWLAALTPVDRSVSLARYLLPVMLIPVVTAMAIDVAMVRGLIPRDTAPLVNVEISSIVLCFVVLPTLRGVWRERIGRETLAHTLQRSPVVVHTHEGLIEYWPRGCEALYGFDAAQAVGRRMRELVQTDYPEPYAAVEAALNATGEWSGEIRQTTRTGETLWVASSMVVERTPGDVDFKIVETLTDITALKSANAALSQTTDRLGQAVAAYDLGIIDFVTATGVTTFSPRMEQLLGFPASGRKPAMRDLMRMMNRVDAAQLAQTTVADVQSRKPQREAEIGILWPNGEQRFLQSMTRYFYDAQGGLERLVGIYMDVTDKVRDRAEVAARGKRLLELQSELAHTSRLSAMGEMAASLAHELNQPLTAIATAVGAIELMLRDAESAPEPGRARMLRAARHAEAQAVRAGEIVRRLREFIARGEADMQRADVSAMIDDALALALPNPAAAGVTVTKAVDPRAATALADRVQIQQVLVNLIRNAIEAMRPQTSPRRLIISARPMTASMAVVSVADTGPGVKGEDEAGLFAAFVSSKSEGMGVGLSICRRIIEGHGGQMWFEPSASGGADFRFTLPLLSAGAAETAAGG